MNYYAYAVEYAALTVEAIAGKENGSVERIQLICSQGDVNVLQSYSYRFFNPKARFEYCGNVCWVNKRNTIVGAEHQGTPLTSRQPSEVDVAQCQEAG